MTSAILRNAVLVGPGGAAQGSLHIVGDRVAETALAGAPEIDLRGHFVFPGLVNAHEHLQVNNVPPLRRREPFPNSYAWAAAFAPHFDDPAVATALAVPLATRYWHGGLKNLLCGATTVAHHDPWHPILDDAAFPVTLLRRAGWCHSLGLAPPERSIDRLSRRLVGLLRGRRLGPFGPPAAGSFRATPSDAPWIIHLAEGTDGIAGRELGRLERIGCLAPNTVIVHGVGLGEEGVDKIIARGAAVVWCPTSNLTLLGATIDPRRLFEAGRLVLGTDSRLSGARDLLEELRAAAAHSDLSPGELLQLVTAAPSRVLTMPEVGGLLPGQRADLVIVRDLGLGPGETLLAEKRAEIRAVVRGGMPAIADRDLGSWFARSGVDGLPVSLDGRPKLLARAIARPDAMACEPGLEAAAG